MVEYNNRGRYLLKWHCSDNLTPIIIWIVRKFKPKKKPKLIAQCPYCDSMIGLGRFKNYICGSCGKTVGFYHLQTKQPFPEVQNYNCSSCGGKNFDGILTCVNCGHYHEDRIRVSS